MRPIGRHTILASLTGAVIAVLFAVGADVLGVPRLLRRPELALYLPAAILGALIGPTRLRPLLWMVAAPVALLAIAIVYTPLVFVLAAPLVRRDPMPARVDAIVALSHGLTPEGLMRSQTLDRLLSGIDLAKQGRAPALLVSQERRAFGGLPVTDSADLLTVARGFNLPVEVILVDSVFTTRTEALRTRRIADQRGWRALAVVTSPLHSRRACATFEAVNFTVTCVPALSREHAIPTARLPEDRLRVFRSWLYETFASATYKSNGWIR